MHFLTFIPNCKAADLEQVAKVAGLADLLGGHDVLQSHPGPADQTGLMLGWLSPTNPRMHYEPQSQTWLPSIVRDDNGKPRYYCGIWNASPPTEGELRRPYTQAGQLVRLANQSWKMPMPDTVDARAVYADDGSMRWEVVRQFAWMCDEARVLQETYLQEMGIREVVFKSDPSAQIAWLLKLLRVNYRITPEVAVFLDLWVGKDYLMDVFLRTLGLMRKDAANG